EAGGAGLPREMIGEAARGAKEKARVRTPSARPSHAESLDGSFGARAPGDSASTSTGEYAPCAAVTSHLATWQAVHEGPPSWHGLAAPGTSRTRGGTAIFRPCLRRAGAAGRRPRPRTCPTRPARRRAARPAPACPERRRGRGP